MSAEAELAISRANEEKDREIEKLSQQVKDLQEVTKRFYDRIQDFGESLSRDYSIEDDVFSSSVRGSARNSASGEMELDFHRIENGVAVIIQPCIGSLGTSPFHRMSLLSESGEDTGIFTENDIQSPTAKSSW